MVIQVIWNIKVYKNHELHLYHISKKEIRGEITSIYNN